MFAFRFSVRTLHTLGEADSLQGGEPAGPRDCAVLQNVRTCLGAHPAFCSVVIGRAFLGLKRPGLEADHFLSADVKNECSLPVLSHMP